MPIRRRPLATVQRQAAATPDNSAAVNAQVAGQLGQVFSNFHTAKIQAREATESNHAIAQATQVLDQFEIDIKESRNIEIEGAEVPLYEEGANGRSHLLAQMDSVHQSLRDKLAEITTLPGSKAKVSAKLLELTQGQSLRMQAYERELFIEDQKLKTEEAANIMVDRGDYEAAIGIYKDAFDAGVITGKKFSDIREDLRARRDYMGLFNGINEASGSGDLDRVVERLQDPPSTLSTSQINGLWRDVDLRNKQMEKAATDEIKQNQDNLFKDLLTTVSNPKEFMSITDIERNKDKLTPGQYQTVLGLVRTQSERGRDDVDVVRLLQSQIATIAGNEDIEASKEQARAKIISQMSGVDIETGARIDSTITPATGVALLERLDRSSDKPFQSRRYRSAQSYGRSVITGMTGGGGVLASLDLDPAKAVALEEFNIALEEYISDNPEDDPIQWAKSNVWSFAPVEDDLIESQVSRIDQQIESVIDQLATHGLTHAEQSKLRKRWDTLKNAKQMRVNAEGF